MAPLNPRWGTVGGTQFSSHNRQGLAACPECKSRITYYSIRENEYKCVNCGLIFSDVDIKEEE